MKLVHEERQFSKNGLAGDLALSSLLDLEDRLLNYARKQVDMIESKTNRQDVHVRQVSLLETNKKVGKLKIILRLGLQSKQFT